MPLAYHLRDHTWNTLLRCIFAHVTKRVRALHNMPTFDSQHHATNRVKPARLRTLCPFLSPDAKRRAAKPAAFGTTRAASPAVLVLYKPQSPSYIVLFFVRLFALGGRKDALAQTDALRCHLYQLVVLDVLKCLFQRERLGRNQLNSFVST